MCNHPRCGQSAWWEGTGPPFVKLDLCDRHKPVYEERNPEMKWKDRRKSLEDLSDAMKQVFG